MSKNGKRFEKFLREDVGPGGVGYMSRNEGGLGTGWIGSQFFRAERDPNSPEEQAYRAGEELLTSIQSGADKSEIEQKAQKARETSGNVDEISRQNKRISPAYWVTNADFEQTFNRPYNAMSREDQRDFFQLVQNAPGATRRTDVAGADAGAVIPSTVRPTPAKKPSVEDLMKPQPGEMDPITGESDWDGRYLTRGQRKRLEAEKSKEQQPKEPTKPSAPRTRISSSTPDWVLNARHEDDSVSPRNLKDAEEIEAIRVGILASQPLPYSERQLNPLEDPTNLLKFVQQYAPETLTAAQKAALGMEGEYRRDLPYARRAAGLEGSPLPPPPPPELLRALEPETKKANEIPELLRAPAKRPTRREKIEATGKKQRESMEARGIAVPGFDVAEKGFGQFNPLEPAPEPAPAPDPAPAPEPEPKPEKAPSFYDYQNRMGTSPLDPQLNAAMAAFQGSGSFAKNLVQSAGKQFQKGLQRINAKAAEIQKGRQGERKLDVAEKGFGQYEGPPLTEPGGGKWEWNEELGAWSYNVGELPPTKISPETELDISKAVMPPEPQQAFAGVDIEGPPKSEAELSKMMRDAREAPKKAKRSGPRGQSLQPVNPNEGYYVFDQTTQDWILVKGGKRTAGQAGSPQTPSFNEPQSRTVTTTPQQVANAISAGEQKKFNQASPITQEIASRMLSVQTPGQVSTQLSGKPLTTQEKDRFKFDSAVPASVAASMNKVTPVRTPLGQEPLTQTEKPIAGGKKGEREMASFTKGMTDAEINSEFEKLFGKEQSNLPTEVKKDMIERFRLAELMQEGGGIMGMNPMYEMEIDPDTGELKLTPKKKD